MAVIASHTCWSDVLWAVLSDWIHAAWTLISFLTAAVSAASGRNVAVAIAIETVLLLLIVIILFFGLSTVLLLSPAGWLLITASCAGVCMGLCFSFMYYHNLKSKDESCRLVRYRLMASRCVIWCCIGLRKFPLQAAYHQVIPSLRREFTITFHLCPISAYLKYSIIYGSTMFSFLISDWTGLGVEGHPSTVRGCAELDQARGRGESGLAERLAG